MKKGMTKLMLTEDEQAQYLSYIPLNPDLLNFDFIKEQPSFAVKNYKDSVYRGEIKDSKRHGKGVITYTNTRLYEGDWFNDKRNGKGFERFSNGNTYLGAYQLGQVHGEGKYIWTTGEYYDG